MVIIYVVCISLGVSVCVIYFYFLVFFWQYYVFISSAFKNIVLIYLHLNIYNLVIEIRKYFGENIP